MRQPIEDRIVTISRAQCSLTFPGEFHAAGGDEPVGVQITIKTR
jgi:predicted ATPase with chaperone activity